jgi:hypothetical protein
LTTASEAGLDYLAKFITNTTTLQYLSLTSSGYYSVHGLRVLAQALHNNSTLQEKKLEITVRLYGDETESDLSQLLHEYPDMMEGLEYEKGYEYFRFVQSNQGSNRVVTKRSSS